MSWQKPFKGLMTIKGTYSNFWVSLYNGDSWIQRNSIRAVKDIAKEQNIEIIKTVDVRS